MYENINEINENLFGKDKKKRFLIESFGIVVEELLMTDILCMLLKKEDDKLKSSIISEDEDNAKDKFELLLMNTNYAYEYNRGKSLLFIVKESIYKALTVDMRILFTKKELGAGKLIDTISKLSSKAFLDYQGHIFPDLELINEEEIQKLINDCKNFDDKMYYKEKVRGRDYAGEYRHIGRAETRILHNYTTLDKYEVIKEQKTNKNGVKQNITTRRSDMPLPLKNCAEMLEEFADICLRYKKLALVSLDGVSEYNGYRNFMKSEEMIKKFFQCFPIEVLEEEIEKRINLYKKTFEKSFELIGW